MPYYKYKNTLVGEDDSKFEPVKVKKEEVLDPDMEGEDAGYVEIKDPSLEVLYHDIEDEDDYVEIKDASFKVLSLEEMKRKVIAFSGDSKFFVAGKGSLATSLGSAMGRANNFYDIRRALLDAYSAVSESRGLGFFRADGSAKLRDAIKGFIETNFSCRLEMGLLNKTATTKPVGIEGEIYEDLVDGKLAEAEEFQYSRPSSPSPSSSGA